MFLDSYKRLCFSTLLIPISARVSPRQLSSGNLPLQYWNTFTYPLPYNGSSRAIFKAGSVLNITWKPGGVEGPGGPITIILTGGILNITIPPEIASGINNTVGSYAWNIPTVLPKYVYYDLAILLDANPYTFTQANAEFLISGLNPTAASSSIPPTPTNSEPSSSTASSSVTSQPLPTTSTDLSLSTKISICIGAVVGGVLLLLILSLFMYRRGKRAAQIEQSKTMEEKNKDKTAPTEKEIVELESVRTAKLQGSTILEN